ncbi:NfeD family protein [Xylella fastidiosa]|uniref:Membrane protein n=2 Tax=Xylella fastidiosa TaxID=2371 RepID=A0A060GXZ3_XYLFS|nr:NfeD family protein [Xylella fastidiosa]AIC09319.1 membrane protein [Xylella fastidiosa subsp. sandyi Ann-1]ALR05626.1 NfeD family protein [Xylella fastidiosa]UIX81462.1 NfeD family protein [Xylella fastidiosa subsp. sandyi]
MRWDAMGWAAAALLLLAAETLIPGAFMLWMGIAAAAVFVGVLLLPDTSLLLQMFAFVVLSFVSIYLYRTWFRRVDHDSDHPLLNRRADQLVGRIIILDHAIVDGNARIKIDDTFWDITGPDLPIGTQIRIVALDGTTLKVHPT